MKKLILLFYLLALGLCQSQWNTLYSFTKGKIYLHLKNNDLVSLNFSISGFQDISEYKAAEINYLDNDKIETLLSPPENSTLLMIKDDLYAFAGDATSTDLDKCGNGVLQLYKFENSFWNKISEDLNFDDISDASYYQYATYLTTPTNNNTIYIFGGNCDTTGEATDRMLSLDLATFKFHNITTSTKPQSFYGASNIIAPNPQSQLVIGGKSNNGWLSMYQLAEWDFDAGWTSKTISSDGTSINSRRFPLTLPVFDVLANDSIQTISDHYSVQEVLLIGGETSEGAAAPEFAKLSLNTNDWTWCSLDTEMELHDILGAATIFNTLVIINSTTTTKRDLGKDFNKRDSQYSISLYDTSTLLPVGSVKSNAASLQPQSSSSSVKTKAILGSVIPICVIAIAVAGVLFFVQRRRRSKGEELESIDYQLGNYYDQHLLGGGHRKILSNMSKDQFDYNHANDSNSTLDGASMDSWVKKRQEFDEKRHKTIKRNSYLASNETLNEHKNSHEIPSSPLQSPGNIEENPFTSLIEQQSPEVYDDEDVPPPPQHHPYAQLSQAGEEGFMNRSVSKLRKSFSFTNTPPPRDLRKKKSGNLPRTALADQLEVHSHQQQKSVDITFQDEDLELNSIGSLDKMDVQVLVSSKRRSKLRVMNPDVVDVKHDIREIDLSGSMRKRVPSGERKTEAYEL